MKYVVNLVNQPFDWNILEYSQTYQTRMQKRIKRHNLSGHVQFDWKEDSGERATKIWMWWKARILAGKTI